MHASSGGCEGSDLAHAKRAGELEGRTLRDVLGRGQGTSTAQVVGDSSRPFLPDDSNAKSSQRCRQPAQSHPCIRIQKEIETWIKDKERTIRQDLY